MKYQILFSEDSDYGQDVLELLAMVTSLTEEKTYNKGEVTKILKQIQGKASIISGKLSNREYLTPFVDPNEKACDTCQYFLTKDKMCMRNLSRRIEEVIDCEDYERGR